MAAPKRPWRWMLRPGFTALIGAVVRIVVLGVLLAHNPRLWSLNEAAGIARQLVLGHGFSTPYHDATGPTAWLAPVYPSMLAGIFHIFGIESIASAWAIVILNIVFAFFTTLVIFKLANDCFGERAAIIAAWVWAISPTTVIAPWFIWETSLSAQLVSYAFWRLLLLKRDFPTREWIFCGLILGFAALLNPALMAVLVPVAVVIGWRDRSVGKLCVLFLVCALCIVPWTIRNRIEMGSFVPMRSNFWPEAYFGNVTFDAHPSMSSMLYQREGEMGFVRDLRSQVIEYVRQNPGAFVRRTLNRIYDFWTQPRRYLEIPSLLFLGSLAGLLQAWRSGREWLCFACVLAFYPLVYYVTYTFSRYRHPIEPVMCMLTGYALAELARWIGWPSRA